MQRILTAKQMRDADDFTINKLGIPEDELVDRAGQAVAVEILKRKKGGRVLICCGKGNNGEDGKIVAKTLYPHHGFAVNIFDIENDDLSIFNNDYDIIVDCLLGTGLNRAVSGKYYDVIEKINQKGCYVVACDIASGLNADTGLAMGIAVKANLTVAVQEFKTGHFLNDGLDYSGEVVSTDIGISIWGDDYAYRMTGVMVKEFFPKRIRNTNKGHYGRVCIIGGSKPFPGAPLLSEAGYASLKMGTGYAKLAVPQSMYSIYAGLRPECTMHVLPDNDDGIAFSEDAINPLLNNDAIAIGIGMGVSEDVYKTICYLLKNYKGKLIIDADGLNSLSKYGVDVLKDKTCSVLVTPHIKEFSRLTGLSVDEIKNDSINLAKQFALDYDVVVCLKNAVSIITDGVKVCINTRGTPAMAKGGNGDVLTGVILGVSAKQNLYDSASAGAYVLGRAGQWAAREHGEYSVTATDITEQIGRVVLRLEQTF